MTIVSEEISQCKSFKSPFITKHGLKQVAVLSGPLDTDKAPGYHNRMGVSVFYTDFKWFQVYLAHCLFIGPYADHLGIHLIHRKMLDVCIYAILCRAFHRSGCDIA